MCYNRAGKIHTQHKSVAKTATHLPFTGLLIDIGGHNYQCLAELSNNKYTCLYVWANKNSKPKVINDTTYFRSLLLVLAGVEQNPGPRTPKYPCAICSKACKWGQRALACDECDHWYHATCTGIDTLEYADLANTSVSWHCVVCNTCNYSTVLYDLLDSADSNTYSVLSSNQSYAGASDSLMSSPGHPQAASSPKPNKPKASPSKRQQSSLRILIIIFQSIKNKRNVIGIYKTRRHTWN